MILLIKGLGGETSINITTIITIRHNLVMEHQRLKQLSLKNHADCYLNLERTKDVQKLQWNLSKNVSEPNREPRASRVHRLRLRNMSPLDRSKLFWNESNGLLRHLLRRILREPLRHQNR
jgi:formate dehydrogenase maturation protein FdhE